jgi:excisionase family DNA binding protein
MHEKPVLTTKEAQELSGLSRGFLYQLLRSGEIEGRRIGRRRWLIWKESLEEWLRGKATVRK